MDEQNDDDRTDSERILDVLDEEYRANPLLIRQRTDLPKQRVYRVLNRLCVSGDVTKICKGLYQIGDAHPNPYTSDRIQQRGAIKFADALYSALSNETIADVEDEIDGIDPTELDFDADEAGDRDE